MTKQKNKDDDVAMRVARGLATLALGMRFNLKEADDVQIALAAIVSAVMRVAELEQRVAALEHQTKRGEAVRALIYRHAPRRLSWRPARS